MRHATVAAIALCVLAVSACDRKESNTELREKLAETESKLQRANRQMAQKDAYIREVTRNINNIQDKLRSIAEREASVVRISGTNPERGMTTDQITEIAQNVTFMENAIDASKRELSLLRNRMRASGVHIEELDTMVGALERNVAEKETRIAELTNRVAELEQTVEQQGRTIVERESEIVSHRTTITEQEARITEQQAAIHTVHWISGTTSELEDLGIIRQTGGFIGFGKTWQLTSTYHSRDRARTYRSGTDVETTALEFSHPREFRIARILPDRDATDFRIERVPTGSRLIVVSPEEFWKDKWLVVMLDD